MRDMRKEVYTMKQLSSDRLLYRVDEVAAMIGVSKATAYDLVNRNQIPSIRLTGRGGRGLLRVPADALRKMIDERSSAQ